VGVRPIESDTTHLIFTGYLILLHLEIIEVEKMAWGEDDFGEEEEEEGESEEWK